MKSILRLPAVLALLAILPAAPVRADSPLGKQMGKMKSANRDLKAALEAPSDARKPEYLALVAKLRAAAVASKELTPRKAAEIPAGDRDKFLEEYRKAMDDLVALIDELQQSIAEGKWEDANEQMALIKQAQREGHEEFRSDDD